MVNSNSWMNGNKMKFLAIVLTSILLWVLIFLSFASLAKAQSLTPYGMWDYNDVSRPQQEKSRRNIPNWDTEVNPGAKISVIPEEPDMISFPNDETPGTVIVSQYNRALYYVIDSETALEYPIAVGREGFQWRGTEKVSRIAEWPEWIPPAEMRRRQPHLPERMSGGLKNPLGAVAIYLGNTLYRIHGSNEPKTIGTESSSGCFRMHNEHAVHLASLVTVGTIVKVY